MITLEKQLADAQKQIAYLQTLLTPIEDSEQVQFREWQYSEREWVRIDGLSREELNTELAQSGIDTSDAALLASRRRIALSVCPELARELAAAQKELADIRTALCNYLGTTDPAELARKVKYHEGGHEFSDSTLAELIKSIGA